MVGLRSKQSIFQRAAKSDTLSPDTPRLMNSIGVLRPGFGGDEEGVAVAEDVVWVIVSTTIHVGDRVALKEHPGVGGKGSDLRHEDQCGDDAYHLWTYDIQLARFWRVKIGEL
jgi:hypothetical protein